MKLILSAILIFALVIVFNCILRLHKRQDNLTRTVRRILWIGSSIIAFNLWSLLSLSEWWVEIAYICYFIATDWLLYYLLRFSLEYIGRRFEDYVKRPLMRVMLCFDSLFVAMNCIWGHLFGLKEIYLFGGEKFFELITYPLFYIHYGIVMMLALFCLISLFYGAFKAPIFYRRKYMLIAVVMLILVVLNFFTLTTAIDVSVIGYAAEGVCIYYCVFVYTPNRLMSKTVFQVTDNMTVGLLAMDREGKRIYCNKYAETYLEGEHFYKDRNLVSLEEWCRQQCVNCQEGFEVEKRFYKEKEEGRKEAFLKIQKQRLVDEKNQYQGCYFIFQDRTKEINDLNREHYLATHDTLTGLYNKEYFYEQTENYLKEHPDEEFMILCSDIKDFKMINDIFGKETGDKVPCQVARMLEKMMKEAKVYGRLENDHFAILLPKHACREGDFENETQWNVAECMYEGVSFPLTNYMGIYEVKDRSLPVSVMCDRARMAIATIKGDQKNTVAYYDDALRDNILHEQELTGELKTAIEQNQIKMFLQPQMSPDGKMLGAEALVRWMHPTKGQIMPGDFIPVFEKNGLITEVDKFIWECACKQLQKWKREGREEIYISVNISPKDMYFLDIHQIFADLIKKYEIETKNLKLEITETAVMTDFKRHLELIEKLRQSGFCVEMDDFGSGYSSLNMLKDIHVDVVKIDMGFLRKNQDTERGKTILQTIITLSKQLGMNVVTEGVETEEQLRFLTQMGCDIIQGYYFSKPIPVEQFETNYMA